MMSSFGVKVPIRRAVLTEDFSYWNAQDIYDYLIQLFRNDSENEIEVEKEILGSYGTQKCRSLYMISYFPDGFMMTIMQVDTSLPHAFLCHVIKTFPFFPNKAWKIKKIEVSTYFYLSLVFKSYSDNSYRLCMTPYNFDIISTLTLNFFVKVS